MQQQPPQYFVQPQPGIQYPAPAPAPGPQVIVAPAPQQYVIQNVPASNQAGCCSGRSDKFSATGGLVTGIIQVIVAVLCIILAGVSYAVPKYHFIYSGIGIWAAIIFYLPSGILGIVSKTKHTGVIIAYLVMCIFSCLEAFGMMVYEGVAAGVHTAVRACDYSCSYSYYYSCRNVCHYYRSDGAIAIHSVLAILAFVEFVVCIVGAAICCGGLTCCCATPTTTTNTTTTVTYTGQPQVQQPYLQQQPQPQQNPLKA